ncbi:MAG: hypothetical protein HGA65_15990 [Oscillochloris sp.]|nr:hypothetical protein [Oscillochloris sp.]
MSRYFTWYVSLTVSHGRASWPRLSKMAVEAVIPAPADAWVRWPALGDDIRQRDPHAEVAGRIAADRREPAAAIVRDLTPGDPDTLALEAADLAADRALKGADSAYVAVARRHGAALVPRTRCSRLRAAPIVAVMPPQEALTTLAG